MDKLAFFDFDHNAAAVGTACLAESVWQAGVAAVAALRQLLRLLRMVGAL